MSDENSKFFSPGEHGFPGTVDLAPLIRAEARKLIAENLSLQIKGPHSEYGNRNQVVTIELVLKNERHWQEPKILASESFSIPGTPGDS